MNNETKELLGIINRVPGIGAAVVTDRDGVAVLKVTKDVVPELALRPGFLSTPAMTADQAAKLGIGQSRTTIAEYENHQVVSFYINSFIVSLIASKSTSIGLILTLEQLFLAPIDELQRVIRTE